MAAPDNSLNLSEFNTLLGSYYREHAQEIHEELNIGYIQAGELHSLSERWTIVDMQEDQLVLPNVAVDDFVHNKRVSSSSTTFNPTVEAVEAGARILQVKKYEGDLQFVDDEIETTHLMYQTEMKRLARNGQSDRVISFVEYLFLNAIAKKAKQTLHKAAYQAVHADTTPYSWNKICNGAEKILTDAVTDSLITPVSMTSPTVTNIETLVESVFYQLGEAERYAADLNVELSPAMHKLWVTRNSTALGRQSTYDSKSADTIYGFPNAKIMLAPYLTANKVFITAKSNKYIGVRDANIGSWEFQRQDRLTKMMLNGKIGVQLARINNVADNPNVAYGA